MNEPKIEIAPEIQIPNSVKPFMEEAIANAHIHRTSIFLTNEQFVSLEDGSRCGGYYSPDAKNRFIKVACDKPFEDWFSVFIHELCHMDQDIEQIPIWVKSEEEAADVIFELWLAHRLELFPHQAEYWTRALQIVEYDCEQRAAKRIAEMNLPIAIDNYIRSANAYIYFYTMAARNRSWYAVSPSATSIINVMPDKFLEFEEYWNISSELARLYDTFCFPWPK